MPDSVSVSSLRTLLKFPFSTPGWTNRFLVGTALLWAGMFVPIIPIVFVAGYVVRVARRVIQGEPPALADWNDWNQLALDGLRAMVIGLAYMAPSFIVMMGGLLLYMGVWFGGVFAVAGNQTESAGATFFALLLVAMAILFLSMFAGWLLWALGLTPLPAALMHFAAQDRLGAAFQPGKWWEVVRADKWGYLAAWVIMLGLWGLMGILIMVLYSTLILCAILPFITAPLSLYMLLVGAAAFGQAYRDGAAQLAQKAPAAAVASAAAAASTEAGPLAELSAPPAEAAAPTKVEHSPAAEPPAEAAPGMDQP